MIPDRRFARHFVLAALTLGCLYLAGRGRLAPPPLAHPSRMPAWWADEGPVVAVFSATRLALLVADAYWLTLLGMVAAIGALSPRRLVRAAPGWRLVGARRAIGLALGATALGSALTGGGTPVFAASPPGPGPAPTITNLAGLGPPAGALPPAQPGWPAPAQPGLSGTDGAPDSTAVGAPPTPGLAPTTSAEPSPTRTTAPGREAQPTNGAPTTAPGPTPSAPGHPAALAPAQTGTPTAPADTGTPSAPADTASSAGGARTGSGSAPATFGAGAAEDGDAVAAGSEWIVRPGDNLWFIADQTLAAAWGRPPSDRQVAGYWMNVIAANRSRLPDPSDPSLLFAGDLIILPPVPSG